MIIMAAIPGIAAASDDFRSTQTYKNTLIAKNPAPLWPGNFDNAKSTDRAHTIDNYGFPKWDDSIGDPDKTDYYDDAIDYDSFEYYGDDEKKSAPVPDKKMNIPEPMDISGPVAQNPEVMEPKNEMSGTVVGGPGMQMINIYVDQRDMPILKQADRNTESEIDKLLRPHKPKNHWALGGFSDKSAPTPKEDFSKLNACPFDTDAECEIWARKPHIKETVANRSTKIRNENIEAIVELVRSGETVTAETPAAAPLVARYRAMLAASRACCTDGITYELRSAGASDGLIYKFLVDDANFYQFGERCTMMTDDEFDVKYPAVATANVVADVRNGCLCRKRQWFKTLLAPFETVYKNSSSFQRSRFNYTYKDGLQREITTSINTDVINVLNQLEKCP